ncbi:DUF7408 domain-containing protein [Candidatus Pristimantibacillus sp. PTI5]|uniref:DUF7408 domain-containing protein n=1 Tax=Candidatus Pristimantibacillus sp. PTI5 TaxID=3400422 RepID=UPI003B02D495
MKRILGNGNRAVKFTVLFSMIIAFLGMAGHVQAAPDQSGISLKASVGYQGYMKQNEWYPARFTLTNTTDEDLKGELVISFLMMNLQTSSDIVIPAELPKGTAIELTASIPGELLNQNNNQIRFFKDSFKSGKTVPIIGNDYISVRTANTNTIGVISRDPDTLNFMPSLNQRGYDIAVLPIEEKELPTDPILWDSIDVLVINDMATASWDENKIIAIQDWVRQGGTLVLSGGAGYSKTAEAFIQIAPVEATGTTNLTSVSSLVSAGGAALKLDTPMSISSVKITDGKTVLAENGLPLAVTRPVGFGSVIYVAFDPSLAPMSTWSGSAVLWASLFQKTLTPVQPGSMNVSNEMYWNMNHLIDQFPSIKPPDFMFLLLMFVGYMIIVAPVLYLILAKADRREWSWWLIPSLSVVMGMVIFFFGAEDKRNISAHTIELIELTGRGEAVHSGATAVFMPTGGTVKAEFDEKVNIKTYQSSSQSAALALDGKQQVVTETGGTSMIWRSVPYWSTRKAWLERRMMDSDPGQLTLAYKQLKNEIEVTAKNDTTTDLTHVSLLINGQSLLFGDLKQGESGKTSIKNGVGSFSGYYSYGDTIFPYPSNRVKDDFYRQRQLVDNYVNRNNGGILPPSPVIIGFSIDHDESYKVNGKNIRFDNLKLWAQKLETSFIDGNRVIVPAGLVNPMIKENRMQRLENYGNGTYSMSDGELVIEYQLGQSEQVTYDKLDIFFNNGAPNSIATVTAWNDKTGKWTEIKDAVASPGEYLINNQTLRMKITAAGSIDMNLPLIAMEGEVH